MADKKDYICSRPFTEIEVMDGVHHLCCASWLKKPLPNYSNVFNAWNSVEANDIRDQILDGSYRYCDSNHCPFLHQLETIGDIGRIPPLVHKSKLTPILKENINKHISGIKTSPRSVTFSMDRSCNLKCPSCRLDLIIADSSKILKVKNDIQDIQDTYGHEVTSLYITGSGDPFISVGFRDFLRNFDSSKWPKLKYIHLHTNATKWNKKMWDSMKNVHPYVKSCEISVDAATRDTYENKTRLNGNWDELMENLKFIATIPNLTMIKPSFVVQQQNYKEMKMFYDLMIGIFGKRSTIYFGKIINWGTFSDDEFKQHQVHNPDHVEFQDFIKELNNTLPAENSFHNFGEYLQKQNLI